MRAEKACCAYSLVTDGDVVQLCGLVNESGSADNA